jgi:nitroreductase
VEPRGRGATHQLDQRAVLALFEAARWAPSANNSRPWRFLVAHRGEESFTRLLGGLHLEAALTPLVVLAVGRRDADAELPEPLAARERAPRSREPLETLMLTAPDSSIRRAT